MDIPSLTIDRTNASLAARIPGRSAAFQSQ
jgi:hypothetical protein